MEKTLEHLKETLEDEIKKITKKGDITPAELESVQKAVCTIDMIKKMNEGESEGRSMDGSYGSYRGYSRRNMRFNPMAYEGSYGDYSERNYRDSYANRMYHDGGSYEDSYGDSYGDSYRRGRSPVTGRYISRNSYRDNRGRNSYADEYSGHSIVDRMVARLENMMDEAKTDHERQTVNEWINRLQGGN